jgi:uncharacterized protein YggE
MSNVLERLKFPALLILISILLLKIFGPIPLTITSTVSNNAEMFTATGTGEATGTPKTASFSVGVTKTGDTVESTQDQVNTIVTKVTTALKGQGIDEKDIKTEQYSINPNIDYTDSRQTTTGYTVSTSITVTLKDAKKANAALDASTKAGANILNNVSFILSDEDREKLEDQAREKAIKEAKKKAEKISSQAGISLGKVIGIYEASPEDPMAYDRATSNMAAGAKEVMAPTQLEAGENKVTVTVTLSYETL